VKVIMRIQFIFAALVGWAWATQALAGPREDGRILQAVDALKSTQTMRDQAIPSWLLARAEGIAIIPNVVKAGIIVGGRGGKGILVIRDSQGNWTNPVFLSLGGGSFGFQAGIETSDVILLFMNRHSVDGATGGKMTLGLDASIAAGPVGRLASAATDFGLSEIYSYSRTKGLFGGLSIDGSVLAVDNHANEAFYDRAGVLGSEIPWLQKVNNDAAQSLFQTLNQLTNETQGTPAMNPNQHPQTQTPIINAPQAQSAPPASTSLESKGATTYPAQDYPPK
jgi:lipid-binding SYLF domain-containing protein